MVIAQPFRGLRPQRWEPVDHLQPRSAGFEGELERAAVELRNRVADGDLHLDPSPTATALWVDEEADGVRRRTAGIVLATRVDANHPDHVLPHEQTFDEPVARRVRTRNRLRLESAATLLLLRDAVEPLTDLLEELPRATLSLRSGSMEADWQEQHAAPLDADRAAHLARAIRGVPALIADGHHRIAAAADPEAMLAGTALTWLVAADAPARLLPVHRELTGMPSDALARLAAGGVHAAPCPASPMPDHPVLVLPTGAFALEVVAGGPTDHALHSAPDVLRELPVTLGHHVLHHILGLGVRRANVRTLIDPLAAAQAVATGDAEAALLACGPSIDQVWAAAEQGFRMPPKATWFVPKPVAGAVLRPLDLDERVTP